MADTNPDLAMLDDDILDVDVEDQEDGTVLIGPANDTDPDERALSMREWDDNLLDELTQEEADSLGQLLHQHYIDDKTSRQDWYDVYEKGLKSLKPEDQAEESRKRRNLTQVVHPVIAEAATQFQARAIGELFPSQGPIGTLILGETHEALEMQAKRIHTFMNYQLTEEMEEYFPEMDQMLFHLPLTGHTFKKTFFDPTLRRNTSVFVHAADLVVDGNATNLATATRYSQIIRLTPQQFDEYVDVGFYEPLDNATDSDPSTVLTVPQEVQGTNPTPPTYVDEEGMIVLIEQHCYHDLESEENEPNKPFIITFHESTKKLCGFKRNWDEDDTRCKKNVWFTSYKFTPGLGFYGFGLYHVIGGLGKAATGALRALLDAASYANMQGGLKLRGRIKSGEIEIAPGEFADIDAAVDDIKKAVMPLPFKEPSQTMFALLEYIVNVAKGFANSAETNISDANQNTPVGTTVALLEENARVFSAIHKRLHYSQRREFKLIAKLNGIYLPEKYPFQVKGGDRYVLRSDFDDRVDVVPVSDPATFSSTQRIAQAQAALQMAQAYPAYHDVPAALQRMYEALRIPNFEEILIDPTKADRMDAVTENVAILNGRPVKAYEDQDHMAHMMVLDDWFTKLPPQAQQMLMSQYASHRAEHMAYYYRVQIQAQLTAPLLPIPDFRDPNAPVPKITPEQDAQISQAAAQITNAQRPQPQPGQPQPGQPQPGQPQQPGQPPQPQGGGMGPPMPPMPQQPGAAGQDDPKAAAAELAKIQAQTTMAKAQADIQAKQMKAQADMQIQQQRAQLDMQIEMIREQRRLKEAELREANKAEADNKKLEAELQMMYEKAEAEIEIAREKADANIEAKLIEVSAKAHIAERVADNQPDNDDDS